MALRAKIVSKIASTCNEGEGAAEKLRGDGRRSIRARRVMEFGIARRGLLLSTVVAASQINTTNDSKTELLQKYLKKTEENRAKNDKERLDNYYKRNYKDYFEFIEGSLGGKKELSESEKGILDWLKSNK